ncbi:hypothetical protein KP79_PYT12475 [Mizuhopecten yessoensis]|uniref:Uncharacterized protein n=1 Tax=Mizuhopecten yessoensis TaxID=6573 RepID=A0A210QJG0_MIZYE|nr:hypothetical protein KP79_PYT12475 [Mizuhopecten yessoensis]
MRHAPRACCISGPYLRIGYKVIFNLLCVLPTLLLGHAPSVGKVIKEKWSAAVSMFQEWRARLPLCRHCGTAPCQVKRRSLWKPSGTRKKDKANFAKRSNAMMLFYWTRVVSGTHQRVAVE